MLRQRVAQNLVEFGLLLAVVVVSCYYVSSMFNNQKSRLANLSAVNVETVGAAQGKRH